MKPFRWPVRVFPFYYFSSPLCFVCVLRNGVMFRSVLLGIVPRVVVLLWSLTFARRERRDRPSVLDRLRIYALRFCGASQIVPSRYGICAAKRTYRLLEARCAYLCGCVLKMSHGVTWIRLMSGAFWLILDVLFKRPKSRAWCSVSLSIYVRFDNTLILKALYQWGSLGVIAARLCIDGWER